MTEIKTKKNKELVSKCLDDLGLDDIEEWFDMGTDPGGPLDSIIPGACVNPDCGAVTSSCEPDAMNNYCEDCGKNSVKSLMVLVGF